MQNQGLPRLQSKVRMSLGNLPRLCLKIIVGAYSSAAGSSCRSYRGPWFSSQHFDGSSQPSITLFQESDALFWPLWMWTWGMHAVHTDVYRQLFTHIKNKSHVREKEGEKSLKLKADCRLLPACSLHRHISKLQ